MNWYGYSGDAGGSLPGTTQSEAFREKQTMEAEVQRQNDRMVASLRKPNPRFSPEGREQFPVKMIVAATDPRIAQLVAMYDRMDERGKLTLLRMAASMPGTKECG